MDTQNTKTEKLIRMFALVYGPIAIMILVGVFFLTTSSDEPVTEKTITNIPPTILISTTTQTSQEIPEQVIATSSIIAFGDSLTAGYGIALSDAYPAQLERILRESGYHVTVANAGVSGETTAGGLRRAQFITNQKPDIVIIALGANDALRGTPPASTKTNLSKIITIFQENNIAVVLAGMQSPENMGESYVREYNAIYPALAKEHAVTLIPFLLDGIALDPTKNLSDNIHPNPEGSRIIAEVNIFPYIINLLSK